jgi:hypothetical protein
MGKQYAAAVTREPALGYMPKTGAGCQGAGKIFTSAIERRPYSTSPAS